MSEIEMSLEEQRQWVKEASDPLTTNKNVPEYPEFSFKGNKPETRIGDIGVEFCGKSDFGAEKDTSPKDFKPKHTEYVPHPKESGVSKALGHLGARVDNIEKRYIGSKAVREQNANFHKRLNELEAKWEYPKQPAEHCKYHLLNTKVDKIDEVLNTVIKRQERHEKKVDRIDEVINIILESTDRLKERVRFLEERVEHIQDAARGRVRDLEGRVLELEKNKCFPFTPADKAKLDMLMVNNNLPPMTHNPIKPQPGSSAVDMTARPTTICQKGDNNGTK